MNDVTLEMPPVHDTLETGRETITIPVVEESLSVTKRIVEGAGVRIVKRVVTEEVTVEEPTVHESAHVERVAVNRLLAPNEPLPKARQEGDTLIIPLFEEIVVVETRTRLTEELHVQLSKTETVTPQKMTIRREEVRVEPLT